VEADRRVESHEKAVMFIRSCHKRSAGFTRVLAVALAVLISAASVSAFAQTAPPAKPSGSVTIHQVQVAFIGSGATGGGTLYYRGRAYPFKVGGLGIGGFGVSKLDASGSVYNLRRLEDFAGVYGQARVGWAAGEQGKGQMWLQNPNGVYLRLKAKRQGLALSLGADGMLVKFGS
jgi:hypothetical protein